MRTLGNFKYADEKAIKGMKVKTRWNLKPGNVSSVGTIMIFRRVFSRTSSARYATRVGTCLSVRTARKCITSSVLAIRVNPREILFVDIAKGLKSRTAPSAASTF
jgi:hypothetical protein